MDLPPLTDSVVELVCLAKNDAVPEKDWVPAYAFDIYVNDVKVGEVHLRTGMTKGLQYSGQIGYIVDEEHRGNGYAVRAVKLLAPVLNFHKMDRALITNEAGNTASQRVCEKIGAKLIATKPTPKWHDTYDEGWRTTNIYEWNLKI